MNNNEKILSLLNEKNILNDKLNSLIYGSLEIREISNKKYAYVHYKEDGVNFTKYIGEYNPNMDLLIANNTIESKNYKKRIKDIIKELKKIGYEETTIDNNIKLNIDFAKTKLAESIYNQAKLEGVVTTFADTESIIEGGKVNNMNSNDVMKIINLKHAWEFIFNESVITSKNDIDLLCSINKFVIEGFYYNAGVIRNTPAKITGTTYIPEIPIKTSIIEDLDKITNKKISVIDKAIDLLLYVMKRQIFIDGNKRTAVIFANKYLIQNKGGVLSISDKYIDEYRNLLIEYYETDNKKNIKKFLKEKCHFKM